MLCRQRMVSEMAAAEIGVETVANETEIINTQGSLFLLRTVRDWNDLPLEVIEAKTMDTFVSRASRLQ